MCVDPVALEDLVSLVSSIPIGSYNVSASYSAGSLNPEGRDLMEAFHLGLVCSKVSHSLHIL